MAGVVSLADVEKAIETVKQSPMVRRTPLLQNVERIFGFADQFKLHLKLESMQNTGMVWGAIRTGGVDDYFFSHHLSD